MRNSSSNQISQHTLQRRTWITLVAVVFVVSLAMYLGNTYADFSRTKFNAQLNEVSKGLEGRYLVYAEYLGEEGTSEIIAMEDGAVVSKGRTISSFVPGEGELFFEIRESDTKSELVRMVDGKLIPFSIPNKNGYVSHMSFSPDNRFLLLQAEDRWDVYDREKNSWIEHVEARVVSEPLVKDQKFQEIMINSELEWVDQRPHELFIVNKKFAPPSMSPYHVQRMTFDPEDLAYAQYPLDASYGPLKVNQYKSGDGWLGRYNWHWCDYKYYRCRSGDDLGSDSSSPVTFNKRTLMRKSDDKVLLKWSSRDFAKIMFIPGVADTLLVQMNNEIGLLDVRNGNFAKLKEAMYQSPYDMPSFGVQVI